MHKSLIMLVMVAVYATPQISYTEMVCLSDTSGRMVYVWGVDTSVTMENVTKVIYGGSWYELLFKDSTVVRLDRPPFSKVEVVLTPPKEKADTSEQKREKHRDDDKDRRPRNR